MLRGWITRVAYAVDIPVRCTSSPSQAFGSFRMARCCCLTLANSDRKAEVRAELDVARAACRSMVIVYCLSRS